MPKDPFDTAMDAVDRAMDAVGDAMDRVGDAIHGKGVVKSTKIRIRLTPDNIQRLLAGKSLTVDIGDTQITIEKA